MEGLDVGYLIAVLTLMLSFFFITSVVLGILIIVGVL